MQEPSERLPMLHGSGPNSTLADPKGCDLDRAESLQEKIIEGLLGMPVTHDEDNATWVMVFPKDTRVGGTVEGTKMRTSPLLDAEQIFIREQHQHEDTYQVVHSVFSAFKEGESVTEEVYQSIVREKVLDVLKHAGLKVTTEESVDKDEIFALISLDRNSSVMRQLAHRHGYRMPFKPEAYKAMMGEGEIMKNWDGEAVPACGEYSAARADKLEPFQPMDEIKLIETHLHRHLSLEWMERQSVISKVFPAMKACPEIGAWAAMSCRPPNTPAAVRDYFGEEICLFFNWLQFYCKMLIPLAFLATCIVILRNFFEEYKLTQRYFQMFFAVVLVLWAATFNQLFNNRSARKVQRWGMDGYSPPFVLQRADFQKALQHSTWVSIMNVVAKLCIVLFCVAFVIATVSLQHERSNAIQRGEMDSIYVKYGSILVVVLIKGSSALWGKLGGILVNARNLQTRPEQEHAIVETQSSVMIFVALWHFLYLAFVRRQMAFLCAPTLQEAAENLWPFQKDKIDDKVLKHLGEHFTVSGKEDHVCVSSCFPDSPEGTYNWTPTNCVADLNADLGAYFTTQMVTAIVMLIVPILLVQWAVYSEGSRVRKAHAQQGSGASQVKYSVLQFQAKSYEVAKYEYKSSGGSMIDDFLQFAIGFSVLTCFGIMQPSLAIMALVANVVQYKLLAYRMTNITCRPPPNGAKDIGVWASVFQLLSQLAVITNTGLAVFVMYPMRNWGTRSQFLAFIIIEHLMFGCSAVIDLVIPDQPGDVRSIDAHNKSLLTITAKYDPITVPEEERQSYDHVDLRLLKDGDAVAAAA